MGGSRSKLVALMGPNAPTGPNTGPSNSVSEPPVPAMIGPQQPSAAPKLRRKQPFRKLVEGGALGRKQLYAKMPKGQVQQLEDEHLAIYTEREALKTADIALRIEKQAIVQLTKSNPQDPQLPARRASAKQQDEANDILRQQLKERQSILMHRCQKMRKDQEKIAEKELYQKVTAELEQTQLETERMYAEASTRSGNRHRSIPFQGQPLRIGDFRRTQQDLQSQSALPVGNMGTQIQLLLPANAGILQPNILPNTPQQVQPDTLQQMQQDNSGVEILHPDILPARYGPGPYGYNNTFIDPELTRDHSTLLSSKALKRRDDRRRALDQILFGPLVPLRQRKDQRERLRKVTHIDYFPLHPKYPKDCVSMVGLLGMLKETASAVKADEDKEATMSAVHVNSKEIPSTAQAIGQVEVVMGSSDIDAEVFVQQQEDLMRGTTDANEAATKHAPPGDSMVGSTDLVQSPSAYRLSFQEQSDLSMDGV